MAMTFLSKKNNGFFLPNQSGPGNNTMPHYKALKTPVLEMPYLPIPCLGFFNKALVFAMLKKQPASKQPGSINPEKPKHR
jgi:hypothetical protein